VVHACHPSYKAKHKIGGLQSWPTWAKMRPSLQNNQNKKEWKHGSQHEAVSSIPVLPKEKANKTVRVLFIVCYK
jgi:hypothetical protein